MAVQTSLRVVARRIGEAIRSFGAEEGWATEEIAIAGTFDEPTERIYLLVGSHRHLDERRWHAGIRNAIRKEFADMPWITSRLVLVVKNVAQLDQISDEVIVGEGEVDITDLF
jgi:hypothetical protein